MAKSKITVCTKGYVEVHGKEPKGYEYWTFLIGNGELLSLCADYKEAKKAAIAQARESRETKIIVGA
jgi:hypothetical protein